MTPTLAASSESTTTTGTSEDRPTPMTENDEYGPRPDTCCGACPPLARGGYDCTCVGNPRCPTNKHLVTDCSEHWPTTVICGSMKFYDRMLIVAAELTLQGRIVLMPFCVVEEQAQNGAAKVKLDELHFKKIDLAQHVVVVTDEARYIGTSTAREIEYATAHGRTIEYRAMPEETEA